MGKVVTVGCKLPSGIILQMGEVQVKCNGTNTCAVLSDESFGITENVDAEFWYAWHASHKDLDMVKRGFLFANEKSADAKAQAKEKKGEKNGMEPLDQNKLPKGLEKVEKTEE